MAHRFAKSARERKPARRTFGVALSGWSLLPLLSLGAGFSSEGPTGVRFERNDGSFLADNAVAFVLVAIVAAGTVGFFVYLHWRDWRRGKDYEDYMAAQTSAANPMSTPEKKVRRKPLVLSPHSTSKPQPRGNTPAAGPTARNGNRGKPAEPTPDQCGILKVSAACGQEQIYIDNRLAGNTPATLLLREGRHVVEVKRPGWRSYRRQVRIVRGTEVSMRPVLVNDTNGRSTEGKPGEDLSEPGN